MHLLLRLALLAPIAAALHAGLLLRFEATDHSGSEPQTTMSKMAVENGTIALDTQIQTATSEPTNTLIYNAANRTMFAVDHPAKIHFKLDEQTFGGLPDTADRMLARMKNVPPQRRAEMEQMVRSRMGGTRATARQRPKPEIVSSGAAAEINGFACDVYEVKRQGVKERELCVAAWSNIAGGAEIMQVMKDMAKFTEAVINVLGRTSPIGPAQHLLADLNELPGFPVSAKEYSDGKLTSENVLQSAAERPLDPETFSLPSGYQSRYMRRQ